MLNTATLTVKNIHLIYGLRATGTYFQHCSKMHRVLTPSKIFWLVIQNVRSMMINELKYITIDACKADPPPKKKKKGGGEKKGHI